MSRADCGESEGADNEITNCIFPRYRAHDCDSSKRTRCKGPEYTLHPITLYSLGINRSIGQNKRLGLAFIFNIRSITVKILTLR